MRLFVLLFLVIYNLLFPADHRTSQSSRIRHQQKREHYQKKEREKNWWDKKSMIGDFSETLARLARNGITVDSNYVTDMVANPIGGKARGFAYAGSYGISVNIDFTKAKLKGFELFCSALWRSGTSLSQRKIKNQFPAQQVFGSQTAKLNELYFLQTLFDRRVEIKAGRLDAGNDFLASPLYSTYVNNGFDGNPIAIFFNVPFSAYPNATWGAYLFFKPHKRLSTKFASYNANREISKTKYHGVNFTFKSTDGVLWITEWCLLVNREKEDHGMPGNYKFGYYYLTRDQQKFTGNKGNGDRCFYLLFDQMIYRKEQMGFKQSLTPFISLLFSPKDRNVFPFFANFGLRFKGPFLNRTNDILSFGYIYGKYSSDLAQVERMRGEEAQIFETVYELNYWAQLNQWFYIAPDLQYIVRPMGRKKFSNAFVIGVQIGVDLW